MGGLSLIYAKQNKTVSTRGGHVSGLVYSFLLNFCSFQTLYRCQNVSNIYKTFWKTPKCSPYIPNLRPISKHVELASTLVIQTQNHFLHSQHFTKKSDYKF